MRARTARAGYTPGALYTCFADKEALASACLARSLGRLHAALRRAGGAAAAGESAGAETVLTFAQLCGLVLADDAGWLEMLGFDAPALIEHAFKR